MVERSINAAASYGSLFMRSTNVFQTELRSAPSNAILTSIGSPIGIAGCALCNGSTTSRVKECIFEYPGLRHAKRGATARQYTIDQLIDVATLRTMIHNCGADREIGTDHGRRWRTNTRFLQIDHNLCIQSVCISAAVAKADDVELDRR